MGRIELAALVALAALAVGAASAPARAEETGDAITAAALAARIDAYVAPLDGAGDLSGTLLVARDGTVLYERAFGLADHELGVANTPATRHGIASVSKPLTAILAATLLVEGKLKLDDPVAKWLPDIPSAGAMTVEHLLRHRSGIPHRLTTPEEETVPRTAADMAALAARAELDFAPGAERGYSSGGYAVLARVLELAGGADYETLLQERVLAPAGAVHTRHADAREIVPGRSRGYYRGPRGPLHAPPKDLSFLVGAGSLVSTPRDLLAVIEALRGDVYPEVVKRELLSEEGLSWNGYTAGFRAFAIHDATTGTTTIFAGNLFTGAGDLLRAAVPRIARGEAVEPPAVPQVRPVPIAPEARAAVEGRYRLGSSVQPLTFVADDFALLGEWVLIPTGDGTFFSPQDYGTVRVERGEDGAVAALQWNEPGAGPRFPREGPLPPD